MQSPHVHLSNNQTLTRELSRFATLSELENSTFFREHQRQLRSILDSPQLFSPIQVVPPNQGFLRVVVWNIERGNRFDDVLFFLREHPLLASADVLLLNEVDVGMVRTGNRHVGFELADALGFHCVYGAEYLEMTKGINEELNLPGENTTALHGNAILSRYPLKNSRILRLPTCFEPFHFHEKRYGSRICIVTEIEMQGTTVLLSTGHLEVRNSPSCRTRQTEAILQEFSKTAYPVIFGGDWNTNTFERGTKFKTLMSTARVLFTEPQKLKRILRHPEEGYEPLFDRLLQSGFSFREFNDDQTTCCVELKGMEDAALLPSVLRSWVTRRVEQHSGFLYMRLDWLTCRGLKPQGTVTTVSGLERSGVPPSDHAPIVADVWFP